MNFFPYLKLTYNSPLAEDEIRKRLSAVVRSDHVLRSLDYPADLTISDYEGQVWDDGFVLERIIDYRNSSLPVINGKFHHEVLGARISVSMRLSIPTLIVGVVMIGMLLFIISEGAMSAAVSVPFRFFPIGMLLFMYLLATIPFLREARIAKKDLAKIFKCEPE